MEKVIYLKKVDDYEEETDSRKTLFFDRIYWLNRWINETDGTLPALPYDL